MLQAGMWNVASHRRSFGSGMPLIGLIGLSYGACLRQSSGPGYSLIPPIGPWNMAYHQQIPEMLVKLRLSPTATPNSRWVNCRQESARRTEPLAIRLEERLFLVMLSVATKLTVVQTASAKVRMGHLVGHRK